MMQASSVDADCGAASAARVSEAGASADALEQTPVPSVGQLLQVISEHKKREHLQLSLIASLEAQLAETRANVTAYRACHDVVNNRLRTAVLDPAVSMEIKTLRQKLFDTETLFRRAKEQLAAQNFSGQSVMGQRLINKCKTLQEENNELGRSLAETHLQPLTIEVAGLKKHVAFLRGELRQLRELNSDMDRDNETMALQLQELSTTVAGVTAERDQLQQEVASLREQLETLRVSGSPSQNQNYYGGNERFPDYEGRSGGHSTRDGNWHGSASTEARSGSRRDRGRHAERDRDYEASSRGDSKEVFEGSMRREREERACSREFESSSKMEGRDNRHGPSFFYPNIRRGEETHHAGPGTSESARRAERGASRGSYKDYGASLRPHTHERDWRRDEEKDRRGRSERDYKVRSERGRSKDDRERRYD
ncbi:conserved hypothetical protein [Neospora caninum Liverpool]|uniref:Pre-mRNA-splicing regulator WTAP n=1 Tax=Neospora caninum (strain Liverpool) TaxID=572307 RepID=F0VCZ9_NEOCL|nr:conserved hypothetical protein [Neospora caninum Liverpool]CBZ51514.1 conserved hypothetical protein [Neospora caninum Liverpool]CEL65464.1 TPA: Pre-mRNA-splicing regulator WTAP [Neospora caninum Liverpool]|eukprot:XP_003881547.1 conserved hypothetical protein [Neospora caninum Liverpool]